MTSSTLRRLLSEVWTYEKPTCRTCGGRPSVFVIDGERDSTIRLQADCHNAAELRIVEIDLRAMDNTAVQAVIEQVRAPWFLRNWAEYRRPTIRELLERRP